MQRATWIALAWIAGFVAVIASGSTGFGERSLRLYDIIPLIGATVLTLFSLFRAELNARRS